MVTFLRKERYVVHYMNLKQAIAHGVVGEKVIINIIIIIICIQITSYNFFVRIPDT